MEATQLEDENSQSSVCWPNKDSEEEVVVRNTIWAGSACCKESVDGACKKRYPLHCQCDNKCGTISLETSKPQPGKS
jgi:hypothetical protein